MPQAWKALQGLCRGWPNIPAARWCYDTDGNLIYATGPFGPIDLVPSSVTRATVGKSVSRLGPLFAQVVRDMEKDEIAQDFYLRALLAIGQQETHFVELPIYGDCYAPGGYLVNCDSPDASPPNGSGWFGMQRSTAQNLGVDWNELASSQDANVRDAMKLALSLEPEHGLDLPTLAAYWNAGGIYADPGRNWGARVTGTYLTSVAHNWNAIGNLHAADFAAPSPEPGMVASTSSHPGRAALGAILLFGTMGAVLVRSHR